MLPLHHGRMPDQTHQDTAPQPKYSIRPSPVKGGSN